MTRVAGWGARIDEVIRLLSAHGALSFSALRALLVPPISEKQLRRLLSKLVKDGTIRRRLFRLNNGAAAYFEIADPQRADRGIGSVHNALLVHNDLCAFAVELLSRTYPGAICVREYAIPRSNELRRVMKYEPGSRDSLPDILLVLPGRAGGPTAFVAVEIERSVKSSKRLLGKFYKYAARTSLDGVLYLSEDERVLSALRRRYQEKIAGRARRVRHYKDHFFVTAGCPTGQKLTFSNPRNLADAPVSLHCWLKGLATASLPERRDESSVHWGGGSLIPTSALL